MDRRQPLSPVESLAGRLAISVADPRNRVRLSGAFAVLSLALATLGVYGVIRYSASRRTHELGLRLALGAQRGELLAMIVGEGVRLGLLGIVLGGMAALALSRLLISFLFAIQPWDALTFVIVAGSLFGRRHAREFCACARSGEARRLAGASSGVVPTLMTGARIRRGCDIVPLRCQEI